MINILESQLTLAAVLLDMYIGVKIRAGKRLVSKDEMRAHLLNIQRISKSITVIKDKNKRGLSAIPENMKIDFLATAEAFEEVFNDLKEYYDSLPEGFEPVAESFKQNMPADYNWMAYNNHQGEA